MGLTDKDLLHPDRVAKLIGNDSAKAVPNADGSTNAGRVQLFSNAFRPPTVEFDNYLGFKSHMAEEVYRLAGNKDDATRADDLTQLLGEVLWERLKTAAACGGLDNEADWLAQHLVQAFEGDKWDTKECDDYRTKADDDPNSPFNVMIARNLGTTGLGRIRQHAKAQDKPISNTGCLMYGTYNLLRQLGSKGHGGGFAAPRTHKSGAPA